MSKTRRTATASARRRSPPGPGPASARGLEPAELAWVAAIPCTLVLLVLIVLLGPPLGHALFPSGIGDFWPSLEAEGSVIPEPTEHGRYLLSLLGPVLLVAALLLPARRQPRLRPRTLARVVGATEALLLVFLVTCVVAQHVVSYGLPYFAFKPFRRVYFTWPSLTVAVLVAAVAIAVLRRGDALRRAAAWTRETRARRGAGLALAVLFTAAWLLTAINTERSIGRVTHAVFVNVPFWLDESFAVLDGRYPLVDFHAQYGQLWPYVAAGVMSLAGASIGAYTVTMATGSGLALLAVYATLRRVVGSSLVALGLYLPFLATGFFKEVGSLHDRYGPSNLFSMFPMRYAGPYALLWLLARQLDGARPRARWLVLAVAGVVALNNVEFGVPAFAATLVALACRGPPRSWSDAARLARDAAIGLLVAAAAVAALTLAVAGSLPHFGALVTFARLYGAQGFGNLPMPPIGFHLAVYVTFAAALVVAAVRLLRAEEDVLLSALLAWSGIFGLGIGSYFAGRSHPEVLIDLFSAWALTVTLLLVVVVRALRARRPFRVTPAELAVLVGFGIAVTSIAQTPVPWSQIGRLGERTRTPVFQPPAGEQFVAAWTHGGEPVAIVMPLGHRIAYDLGIENVSPYVSIESIPTLHQLLETVDVLRRAGGSKLFLSLKTTRGEQVAAFGRAGFRVAREDHRARLVEMVDAR